MKIALSIVLSCLGTICSGAEVVFKGYMTAAGRSLFVITVDEKETSPWLTVGQEFGGFSIVTFDGSTEVLTVERNGQRQTLRLAGERVQSASQSANKDEENAVTVSIGTTEAISVGADPSSIAMFKTRLASALAADPLLTVTIRPHKNTPVDRVRDVTHACWLLSVHRISLKTD